MSASLRVGPSQLHGLGLFTSAPFTSGQVILLEGPRWTACVSQVDGTYYTVPWLLTRTIALEGAAWLTASGLVPIQFGALRWEPRDDVALNALVLESLLTRNDLFRLYGIVCSINLQYANGCLGIYPLASHLNHACVPNARCTYDGTHLRLVAVQDVSPDTEITIAFVESALAVANIAAVTRHLVKKQFGFECRCPAHGAT
jgi:hypothetical protein